MSGLTLRRSSVASRAALVLAAVTLAACGQGAPPASSGAPRTVDRRLPVAPSTALTIAPGDNTLVTGLGGPADFGEIDLTLQPTLPSGSLDDAYWPVDLSAIFPNGVDFFGTRYDAATQVFVGTNGYITFREGMTGFDPLGISYSPLPIVAVFFADQDFTDRGGGNPGKAWLDVDTSAADPVVTLTYYDVLRFPASDPTLRNRYQIRLHRVASNAATGDRMSIELRYEQIQWLDGDASLGTYATAGWSDGAYDGSTPTQIFAEVVGSGTPEMEDNATPDPTFSNLSPPQAGIYSWVPLFITAQAISTPQSALPGRPFPQPLIVEVVDGNGVPVQGATVRFAPPVSGPRASVEKQAVTGADGRAQVMAWAGIEEGTYEVRAFVAQGGYSVPVNFTLTNLAQPPLGALLQEGFEAGLGGFTAETTSGLAAWTVLASPETLQLTPELNPVAVTLPDDGRHLAAAGGTHVAWFGEVSTGSYIGSDFPRPPDLKGGGTSNGPQSGLLTAPSVDLSGYTAATLEFDAWWEIEGVAGDRYDLMAVQASTDGGATWSLLGLLNPTIPTNAPSETGFTAGGSSAPPVWRHYVYDLSTLTGQTVLLQFAFDTRDESYNGFRGWTLDNVVVQGGTEVPAPYVSSLEPAIGGLDDVVTAHGASFAQGARFYLGATEVTTVTVVGAATAFLVVPAGLVDGPYDVTVVNPDGKLTIAPDLFTFTSAPSPKVFEVSPTTTTPFTAGLVTVTGSDFVDGAQVYFGTTPADGVTFVDAGTLEVGDPGLPTGTYNVRVVNPSGQSGILYGAYAVGTGVPPILTIASPAAGDRWTLGDVQSITWTASDVSTITIELWVGGALSSTLVTGVDATAGSWAWGPVAGPVGPATIRLVDEAGLAATSESGVFDLVPAQAPTATALQASSLTPVIGAPVTFTATVTAGGSPVPAGTDVEFRDGATLLGAVATDAAGQAALTTSTLGSGSHLVTAAYPDTAAYLASTSAAVEVVVGMPSFANVCYAGGSLLPNFRLNGDALLEGTGLVLTPDEFGMVSSIMYGPKFRAASDFHLELGAKITTTTGDGADGMAFVMHNAPAGSSAIGASGGGIGYEGIPSSVVVEFDTYTNGWDINDNHVALTRGGVPDHGDPANAGLPVVDLSTLGLNLKSGSVLHLWLDYAAASGQLDVYLAASATKPASPALQAVIDLSAALGPDFFVGFTASTGGEKSKHEVPFLYASDTGAARSGCCDSDADCAGSPAGPACDTAKHLCGACTVATSATACDTVHTGNACDLTPAGNVCNTRCGADFGSGQPGACASAAFPACMPTGACAACNGDAGTSATVACGGGAPYCDATGYCGRCSTDADCTSANAARGGDTCNPFAGTCVGVCTNDAQCGAGFRCDPASQVCARAPAGLSIVGGGAAQVAPVGQPFAAPLTVRVVDQAGSPLPGAAVTFTTAAASNGADAVLSGVVVITDQDGLASVTATANLVGSLLGETYQAFASDVAGHGVSFELANYDPILPAAVLVPGAGWVPVGQSRPVTVQVVNAQRQGLAGVPVAFARAGWSLGPDDLLLGPDAATTDAQGYATFTLQAGAQTGGGAVEIAAGGALGTFSYEVYDPAIPTRLHLLAGENQRAAPGAAFAAPIVFEVDDAAGDAVRDVPVSVWIYPSADAASLSAATVVTDRRGRGQVTLTAGPSPAWLYVVLDAGFDGAWVYEEVADQAEYRLRTPNGADYLASPGGPLSPEMVVQLVDGLGVPLPGESLQFEAFGDVGLSATSGATDDQGKVTVPASGGASPGPANLLVSHPQAGSTWLNVRTVAGSEVGAWQVVSGGGQSAPLRTPFAAPVVVRLVRYDGTPVANAPVGWYAQGAYAARATFAQTAGVTDANGEVAIYPAANAWPGSYELRVWSATFNPFPSEAVVPLTNLDSLPYGPPVTLAVQSGDGQSAPLGAAFGQPLVVKVTDVDGYAVPGVEVAFAAPASGAAADLSAISAITDADGLASVTATANLVAGGYTVTASATGVADATFGLTNLRLASQISLAAAPAPSTFGETVTFTATLTGAGATPTGAVTFSAGGAVLCLEVPIDAGQAACASAALGAGTTTVTATYLGDATYDSSSTTLDQEVAQAAQAIAFAPPASVVYGDVIDLAPFATGGPSGSPVTFGVVSGPATLAGTTLTVTGVGPIVVAADQAGSADYLAAPTVTGTLEAGKATALVQLGGLAQTYTGAARTVTATTTPSGLTVAVTYAGSATAPIDAGSYAVEATVVDENWQGSASGTLVVGKATAQLALSNLSQTYDGTARVPNVSTLPVGLTISLTYNGSATPPVNTGAYTVVATVVDANWQGSRSSTLVVGKATAQVQLSNLAQVYDGTGRSATATTTPAGLFVSITYDGQATLPVAVGSYAVFASVVDNNHSGAASGTLVITKGTAPILLGNLAQTYDGTPRAVTATTTPAGLTVALTYAGDAAAPVAAGSYPVVATVVDANWQGSASGTLVIGKATAQVALAGLAQTYDGTPRAATATTTPAGLTVSLTYAGDAAAPVAAGSYAVVGTVVDDNWQGSASGTLVIGKATAEVALAGLAQTYDGTPRAATATTTPAGLTVAFTYAGDAAAPVGAGSYAVVGTVVDDNWQGSASGTLVVAKAAQQLTFTPPAAMAFGDAALDLAPHATGGASGTPVTFAVVSGPGAIVGTSLVPSGAGAVVVVARQATSANWLASPEVQRSIQVGLASTAVAVASSRPVAKVNQPIVLTATVTAAGPAGTPTGTVTFTDGATTLGTATLSGGSASLGVPSLPKGTHPITATYAVSADFQGASGTLPDGQVIADSAPVAGAGQALGFDGETRWARLAGDDAVLEGVRTVELWFQGMPGTGRGCLVQRGGGTQVQFGLCLTTARDGLVVRRGAEATVVPVAMSDGWHHLALVVGAEDTVLLVDGLAVGALAGGLGTGHTPLTIGAATVPGDAGDVTELFVGQLDELRLWSTARTAAQLAADAHRPVAGDAEGLLALWRMDEGEGASLFDAGPSHLEAAIAGAGPEAWTGSTTWTRRATRQERALAPFLAGYDPDGDALEVTISGPALHGTATPDGELVGYLPADRFLGADEFTVQVAAGGLSSEYRTQVEVTRIELCQAQADCAGGDVCINDRCEAPASLDTGSGGGGCGCTTGGGSPGGLLILLVLAFLPRRRIRPEGR